MAKDKDNDKGSVSHGSEFLTAWALNNADAIHKPSTLLLRVRDPGGQQVSHAHPELAVVEPLGRHTNYLISDDAGVSDQEKAGAFAPTAVQAVVLRHRGINIISELSSVSPSGVRSQGRAFTHVRHVPAPIPGLVSPKGGAVTSSVDGKAMTDITRAEWLAIARADLSSWDPHLPVGAAVFAICFVESECNKTNAARGYNPGNLIASGSWPSQATYTRGSGLTFRAYDAAFGVRGVLPDPNIRARAYNDVSDAKGAKLVDWARSRSDWSLMSSDMVASSLADWLADRHYYVEDDNATPAGEALRKKYARRLSTGLKFFSS